MSISSNSAAKVRRIDAILPALDDLVRVCRLCGNVCDVDRTAGEIGLCRTATGASGNVRVASATPHFGEEPVLVGRGGSGTVFFTHCNLRCVFCQNWQISQGGMGEDLGVAELAATFLRLQGMGVENINLVTPTHVIHVILPALREAFAAGLDLPVVYNTNGFDSTELLRLLDGIVDVYLPDLKYMDPANARRYSKIADYPPTAKAALLEMVRQQPELVVEDGTARRGVILRHLVLPGDVAGSYEALLWLADEGLTDLPISLMSQYSPQHRAREHPALAEPPTMREYRDVVDFALDKGFTNLWVQGLDSRDNYLPDFRRDRPFED